MAKVEIRDHGPYAGVWVSTEDGDTIALLAHDGEGAYLAIYPKNLEGGRYPFALSVSHADHLVDVQIPGPDGAAVGTKVYSLDQIVKAIAAATPGPA